MKKRKNIIFRTTAINFLKFSVLRTEALCPQSSPKNWFTVPKFWKLSSGSDFQNLWRGVKTAEAQEGVEFTSPHKHIKNTSTNGTVLTEPRLNISLGPWAPGRTRKIPAYTDRTHKRGREKKEGRKWDRICAPGSGCWSRGEVPVLGEALSPAARSTGTDRKLWGLFIGKDSKMHSSVGKVSVCSAADPASIAGPGSSPGEGYATPLSYSCHRQRSLVGYSSWDPKSQTRCSELVLGLQQPVCGQQDNVRPTEMMWGTALHALDEDISLPVQTGG